MSNEYYSAMLMAFTESAALIGTNITLNGTTAKVIATRVMTSLFLKENGYLPEHDTEVEMLREDFNDMGIVDRTELSINGRNFEVIGIGDDDAEPCVMIRCKATR